MQISILTVRSDHDSFTKTSQHIRSFIAIRLLTQLDKSSNIYLKVVHYNLFLVEKVHFLRAANG